MAATADAVPRGCLAGRTGPHGRGEATRTRPGTHRDSAVPQLCPERLHQAAELLTVVIAQLREHLVGFEQSLLLAGAVRRPQVDLFALCGQIDGARGDVIEQFNASKIKTYADLERELNNAPIGSRQKVTVIRGRQRLTFQITIAQRK